MSYIFKYLGQLFKFLFKNSKYLSKGFAGLFILSQFFIDWFKTDIMFAFVHLAKSILAAELTINEVVHKAIINVNYGLGDFLAIVSSLFILYFFIRTIAKIMIKSFGANVNYGAYFWATVIVFIIEISAVRIIDGSFGFIPIKDGVWFLFMNLSPVLSNIFSSATPVVLNNITVNSTLINNTI